nr:hypothetical protein [Candidatus Baldrarchaeota archaeon]
MLGEKCNGAIIITTIENAVPEGFKIFWIPEDYKYNVHTNTLYLDQPLAFDIMTLKFDRNFPDYILEAVEEKPKTTYNPIIVFVITRESKPIAKAKFKLFKKKSNFNHNQPRNTFLPHNRGRRPGNPLRKPEEKGKTNNRNRKDQRSGKEHTQRTRTHMGTARSRKNHPTSPNSIKT